tara:strand:- start:12319 stop:13044 length:726 start_codon:yes stop_codon:yes gene_type:complete
MTTIFEIIYGLILISLILYTKGESAITHPKFKSFIKKVNNLSIWLVRKSLRSKLTNFYKHYGRLLRRMMIFNFFLMGIVSLTQLEFVLLLILVVIEIILLIIYSTVKPIPVYIANMRKSMKESFLWSIICILFIGFLWMKDSESFNKIVKIVKEIFELIKEKSLLLSPSQVTYLFQIVLIAILVYCLPFIWRMFIFILSRVYKLFISVCFRLNHRKPIRPAILLGSIGIVIFTKTLEIILK